jgi:TolB protein
MKTTTRFIYSVITTFLVCSALMNVSPLAAQALPEGEVHTVITTSRIHRYKVAVAAMPAISPALADSVEAFRRIQEMVIADLDFSLRFELMNRRFDELTIAALGASKGSVDFRGWKSTDAEYLVAGSFYELGGKAVAEIRVYDLGLEDLVFLKNYTVSYADWRLVGHRISDDVVLNVTGERGVATTRIAFVRDHPENVTEVYTADYDGYGSARITNENTIVKLPSWSPDGKRLAYTAFKDIVTDPDLYVVDVAARKVSLLHAAKGVDMVAHWCDRNGFLAFSSGVSGDQEIYFLRPGETKPNRLTFSYADDFDPTWSPNGVELAFTSTRAGNPHIYLMGADGLNVRRLTFESRNTTPRWRPLPYGDKILVTSEIGGIFQIAIIDTNGDNFIQLTTQGENRDATWSPDGLHIVFASDRRGGRGRFEIYTMDWDGNSQRPLHSSWTPGKEPSWSPYLDR